MDEHLKMADAYYAVARDLHSQGQRMLEIANVLNTMADSLCEANIRKNKAESAQVTPMERDLLPCPFCGAGEIRIKPNTIWTGMRSEMISVEVYHWCETPVGVQGSHVTMRAKTEAEAVAKWNKRADSAESPHT